MKLKKETLTGSIIIAVSVVLTVVGFLILPEELTVQIGLDGQASNTLPKLPALLIPLAMSTVFSILYMRGTEDKKSRNLIVAVIGIGAAILMFVVNL